MRRVAAVLTVLAIGIVSWWLTLELQQGGESQQGGGLQQGGLDTGEPPRPTDGLVEKRADDLPRGADRGGSTAGSGSDASDDESAAEDTAEQSGAGTAAATGGSLVPEETTERPRRVYFEGGVAVPGEEDVRVRVKVDRAPSGLRGETGEAPGVVSVQLSSDVERELSFRLRSEPEGALVLADDGGVVTVRPGQSIVPVRVRATRSGPITVRLSAVGADGRDVGEPFIARLEAVSVVQQTDAKLHTRVQAGPGHVMGSQGRLEGAAGMRLGALDIARTGFAGIDEQDTRIDLEVDDPDGVLEPLPDSVTIPAGKAVVSRALELVLRRRAGVARIWLRAGAVEKEVAVTSTVPTWSVMTKRVVVPVGGQGRVKLRMAPQLASSRTLRATSADPVVATPAGDGTAPIHDRMNRAEIDVVARSVGATRIGLACDGLDDQSAEIEVLPGFTSMVPGEVRVTPGRAGGPLRLTLDGPNLWKVYVTEPEEVAGLTVKVDGHGTSQLRVSFDGAPPDPDQVVSFGVRVQRGEEPVVDSLWLKVTEERAGRKEPLHYILSATEDAR